MSVLAHSLIHSFAHSFIDQSTKQASEQASNQPTNQHTLRQLGTPPTSPVLFLTEVMPGKTLRKMKNALCQDILQLPFSRFLLKLNHVGHHVVFFQLIEAIFQLQTLEKQEAHLLFNITSPGVPRLHIE